jgi:DNA-binding MarR family transcriptional regulator
VTRQHIQTISNELRSLDLIEMQDNPAHRRSPMVALTAHGSATIDAILERERTYLASHVGGLDVDAIRSAARTLAEVRRALAGEVR